MRLGPFLLLLLLPLLLLPAAPLQAADLRILFVGNSLTYSNDLPAMVRRIGKLDGRTISTEMLAAPNFSLEDHLLSGQQRRAIKRRNWDVIVLQQGPSSLDESRQLLIRDTIRVRHLVRHDATIAVLTVWPDRNRLSAFDRVIESHRLAADAAKGQLIPAGSAWRAALEIDPAIALYSRDGFHPSPLGTYLAALEVYRTVVGPLPEEATELNGARTVLGGRVGAEELETVKKALSH